MTLEELRRIVLSETDIDVTAKSRKQRFVEARALFCEIAIGQNEWTFQEIADFLNLVSHASVLNYQYNNFYSKFKDYQFTEERERLLRYIKVQLDSSPTNIVDLIKETRTLAINFEKILTGKQKAIELCLKTQ